MNARTRIKTGRIKRLIQVVKKILAKPYFIAIKLPLMLFAIVLGFILDALFALPFVMLLIFNYRGTPKKNRRPATG
jgi:hypothetical protein